MCKDLGTRLGIVYLNCYGCVYTYFHVGYGRGGKRERKMEGGSEEFEGEGRERKIEGGSEDLEGEGRERKMEGDSEDLEGGGKREEDGERQ